MTKLVTGFFCSLALAMLVGPIAAQEEKQRDSQDQKTQRRTRDGEQVRRGQGQRGDRARDSTGAGQQRRRGQRGEGQERGGGRSPIFQLLDTNRDGNLSAKEIDNAAAALRKLDTDKDGNISPQELRAVVGDRNPREGAERGERRRKSDQEQDGDQRRRGRDRSIRESILSGR